MASDTASTIPPISRASDPPAVTAQDEASADAPEDASEDAVAAGGAPPHTGSLARRIMVIAAGWITILLLLGGLALNSTITTLLTRNFDEQLEYLLTAMVSSTEIDQQGEVLFNRPLGDQRFLEPNSGLYWQISGKGHEVFPSRSLWDRTLTLQGGDRFDAEPEVYDSDQFPGEPLRVIERSILLPASDTQWHFVVAASREDLDAQIVRIRSILIWSFAVLGLGLFLMAGAQTWYGLSPDRKSVV